MLHLSYQTKTDKTEIFLANHLLDQLDQVYQTTHEGFIIADEKVPKEALEKLKAHYDIKHMIRIPSGDGSKSLSHYEAIIDVMVEKRLTKATTIFAVGGGMIGDLAGFIASTYFRGLELINIPTTLLAMVDASIGGKNALNVQPYKNIVGTFYQPKAILIDPTLLETLSPRHFNNGFAEIIKIALVKDATFFDDLRHDRLSLDATIKRAIELKIALVEKDPFDHNQRHLLNYGHTIAHALESHYGTTYLHGECVASGIKQMTKPYPFHDDVVALLKRYDLDFTIPYRKEALFNHILHDKKRSKSMLSLAIVEKIGEGYIKEIPVDEFIEYL